MSKKMDLPWRYAIVHLPAQYTPMTRAVFLECRDENGNYRGFYIGRYTGDQEARTACAHDKSTRTDWRTATTVDSQKVSPLVQS